MSLGDSTSETDSIRIDHFCYTVWSIKSHSTYIGCLYAQTEFRKGEGLVVQQKKLRARLLKQRWGWGIAHMMMIVMAQWGILDQITAGGSVLESRYLGWGTACFNSLWNVGTQGVGQGAQLCHCEEHSTAAGQIGTQLRGGQTAHWQTRFNHITDLLLHFSQLPPLLKPLTRMFKQMNEKYAVEI